MLYLTCQFCVLLELSLNASLNVLCVIHIHEHLCSEVTMIYYWQFPITLQYKSP